MASWDENLWFGANFEDVRNGAVHWFASAGSSRPLVLASARECEQSD